MNGLLAPEAERALVASLLIEPERLDEVVEVVRPADLADPALRVVYAALCDRHAKGEPIEVALVLGDVKCSIPTGTEARDLLTSLAEEAVSGLHAASYAAKVAEAARLRVVHDEATSALRLIGSGVGLDSVAARLREAAEKAEPIGGAIKRRPPAPAWRPPPVHALPEPFRSLVIEGARSIGCDESFVALPGMAAAAGAIGATRVLRLKRDWREPAVLWCAVVAPSGATKSQGRKLVLGPLWKREADERRRYEAAMAEFGILSTEHEREVALWKKGKSEGTPPEGPVKPELVEFTFSDATIEAATHALNRNPRGMLLERDELAAWFRGFNAYRSGGGGADAQAWMECHGAGRLKVNRVSLGTAPITVPRACVSVTGTIQPELLSGCLSGEHLASGLAARLLFASPPQRAKRWTDDEVSRATAKAWGERLAELLDLEFAPPADDDAAPEPIDCYFASDAQERWKRFVNEHGREGLERDGAELAAWSKLEGYAARLALVFHLIGDPHAVEVSLATLESALEWAAWFAREAERFYRGAASDPREREVEKLVAWIAAHGGAVTARELAKGPRQYRAAGAAERALQLLVEAGVGSWQHDAGAGRPTQRFRLGPSGGGGVTPANPEQNGPFAAAASVATPENTLDLPAFAQDGSLTL
jgi:hypothetical protein